MEAIQQAFDRVRKNIEINERGCWIWQGSGADYGQIKVAGRNLGTHRVAYMAVKGEIPRGKVIRHKCDDSMCCNPDHLVVGDHEDNNQDIVERGRARARRILNSDETAKVLAMRAQGQNKRVIADALHCNWYAVTAAIDRAGIDVKKSGRPKGSKNTRVRVTPEMKQQIKELYATGKHTQQALAERFGCDQTYVSLICKE